MWMIVALHHRPLVYGAVNPDWAVPQQIHVPVVNAAEQAPSQNVPKSCRDQAYQSIELVVRFSFPRRMKLDSPFQIYRPTLKPGVRSQIPIGIKNMFATT